MPWSIKVDAIRAAEKKLGVRFPTGFIAGMTKCNGGSVRVLGDVWILHPFLDASDKKRMARTSNDIVRETKSFREMEWFPQGGVVLASLDGNCLLLLPEEGSGQLGDEVFVWYMDAEGVEVVFGSTADMLGVWE